jgi:type I restriction enzyme S subunit
MTSEFLYTLTKSSFYKNWVKAKQNVVAQPNINANQYGNELLFPLPPIKLQKKFTDHYNILKKNKSIQIKALIKLKQLQISLQHNSFVVN